MIKYLLSLLLLNDKRLNFYPKIPTNGQFLPQGPTNWKTLTLAFVNISTSSLNFCYTPYEVSYFLCKYGGPFENRYKNEAS